MYKKLWDVINKIVGKEYTVGIYLAVDILCWTAVTVLVGMLGSLLLWGKIMYTFAAVLCVGVYMGIIFGLFGGILFLQRNTEPKDLQKGRKNFRMCKKQKCWRQKIKK